MATKQAQAPIGQHHDERKWLDWRRSGIGGSEIAALFEGPYSTGTMHPWLTIGDLYRLKTEPLGPPEDPTPDQLRGHLYEPLAAERYSLLTGRKVRRQPGRRHPEHPFLVCTIDRQILSSDDRATGVLEVKAPRIRKYYDIKRNGLRPEMILQGQHNAFVWDYPFTDFAIWGSDEAEILHGYDVEQVPEISNRIVEVAGDFWLHVERREPPPENETKPDLKLPEVKGEITRIETDEFRAAAIEYFEARELEAQAKAIKEAASEQVKHIIGGALGAFEGFGMRFYHGERAGSVKHAQTVKKLRAIQPLHPERVVEELALRGVQPAEAELVVQAAKLDIDSLEERGKGSQSLVGYQIKATEE